MDGNALRLSAFTKKYNKAAKKRDRTLAVDELSLDVFAGTIMVLLGANGSGKSTTLNCVAGLESITNGRIDVDRSGGIGLCPQRNVMWADMTVEEHVWFFQRLKNPKMPKEQSMQEVKRLIDSCDLAKKTNARSKTLSGGQQRKLQLCMMLAGGSRVCCIDEASSGIDPLARRKIWNILLAERGHRTMILTTHFLDESEVLADHIALMSKGKLRALGTVAELKNSLGDGFSVIVPNARSAALHAVTGTHAVRQQGDDTIFQVADGAALSQLLGKLDERGAHNYKVEGPSVEKIFLRLADEMKAEDRQEVVPNKAFSGREVSQVHESMALHTGRGSGAFKQTGVLFRKRLTILKHNFMPYVAALFVPLVVAGLVTRFLLNVDIEGLQCANPNQQNIYQDVPESLTPDELSYSSIVLGPRDRVTTQTLASLIPTNEFCYPEAVSCNSPANTAIQWTGSQEVNSLSDFNAKVQADDSTNSYGEGGFFVDPSGPPVLAWLSDEGFNYPPFFMLGSLDMVLSNTSVGVSYNTFEYGYAPKDFYQSLVAVFTCLGFVLFPGLFA